MSLSNMKCEACQAGAPQVTDTELAELIREIPLWQPVLIDNIMRITRTYTFKNFKQALAFTNQVGELAESEGHHPEIVTEWGSVRVSWWTHKIRGLHRNDFICAAKTDALKQAE
ncbi:4a-hydroxytetrahydrobiopterin dehydratase [Aestuariirhabdus litorea]